MTLPSAIGLLLGLALPGEFVIRMLRRDVGRAHRCRGLESLLSAVAGLILAWHWVSWDVVPRLVYAVPVALTAYGTALLAVGWRQLPWLAGPHPRRAVVSGATTAVLVGGLALLIR